MIKEREGRGVGDKQEAPEKRLTASAEGGHVVKGGGEWIACRNREKVEAVFQDEHKGGGTGVQMLGIIVKRGKWSLNGDGRSG